MVGLHLVWIVTMMATLLSIAFSNYAADGGGVLPVSVGVMLVAGFKARLVLLHFMEVRHAPALWRGLLEGWILTCVVVIAATHLYG